MTPVTFGPVDEKVAQQLLMCLDAEDGAQGVLCADNHVGYSMPIGGVVAYRNLISPSAVGFDIGCGNMAVRTDATWADVRKDIPMIMNDIYTSISFGMGRKNSEKVEHGILDEIAGCDHLAQRGLAQLAAQQLGTVGSGNHYVDLFVDEGDHVWIGVHFGSRGFGHKTATWALDRAGATSTDMMAPPCVIAAQSSLGQAYIDGMERAGAYAYAGREWVVGKVLRLLGAKALETVHNHHNYAWHEEHQGETWYVHRKGATPAFPGQRGFVGASMGEAAVILQGVAGPLSASALYSTVHGAGRVMSRMQAAGKTKVVKAWRCGQRGCQANAMGYPLRDFTRGKGNSLPACPLCAHRMHQHQETQVVRAGLIDFAQVQQEMREKGIELRGAGADEAPGAYKRLSEVLTHHAGTVEVLHTLMPIGVAMAGKDVWDEFKD